MVIRNKAELRKTIRNAVKKTSATEVCTWIDWTQGDYGVDAMLNACCGGAPTDASQAFESLCVYNTPFNDDAADMFHALSALKMPKNDVQMIRSRQQQVSRQGYSALVIEKSNLDSVYFYTDALDSSPEIKGLVPVVNYHTISRDDLGDTRYGAHFHGLAQRTVQLLKDRGAKDLRFDMAAFSGDEAYAHLRYCVLPLCDDNNIVLHVRLQDMDSQQTFFTLMEEFGSLACIVSAAGTCEAIEQAKHFPRVLLRVEDEYFSQALGKLGTRFIPFSSEATLPDQLIGRWSRARFRLTELLCEAHLSLARAGYEILVGNIEDTVRTLLGGNIKALYLN